MSLNKILILGRLTKDPDYKVTPNGASVVNFDVATNERWKNKQGEWEESVEYHKIVVWGKSADACNSYLKKGREVFVEGKIETRKWQDKEGKDRYTTEIKAAKVDFLGSGEKSGKDGFSF